MVEFGADQLVDHRRDSRFTPVNRVCELTQHVVFHRLDADFEVGEALAEDRILRHRFAVANDRTGQNLEPVEQPLRGDGRPKRIALVKERRVGYHPTFVDLAYEVFTRNPHVVEEYLVEAARSPVICTS